MNASSGTKHICLVTNSSWSIIKFRKLLVQRLIADGYKVSVVAPKDEYTQDIMNLGARFILLKNLNRKGKNPFKDVKLIGELKRIFNKLKPSIIFQYTIKPNIYSTIAAHSLGIPCIAIITGLGYTFINRGLVPAMAKKMYRYALKRATQVWFLNDDDMQLFLDKNLVEEHKVGHLNGEGVDTDRFFPRQTQAADKFTFLLIARLLYDKGVREYVEAARIVRRKYPHAIFQMLGYLNVDNPKAVDQQQMDIWTSEGVVQYLGTASDVRELIADCNCVVLPSYREGISVTLMEGAAMGKPLIATDIPGCRDLIEDGVTGLLCKVRSVNDLVQKLEKMILVEEPKRQQMGALGRQKIVDSFSFNSIYPTYESCITRYSLT